MVEDHWWCPCASLAVEWIALTSSRPDNMLTRFPDWKVCLAEGKRIISKCLIFIWDKGYRSWLMHYAASRRSQVRVPIRSLIFKIYLIFPAALDWGFLSP
jgi:hypothetical protein